MDTSRIRPIAICLFRNNGRILVSEGFDTVKQSSYYRPLGGGVEYGETSRAAVLREIQEEIAAQVEDVELLGVLENIFIYNGEQGHEIVFVFNGKFLDKSLYHQPEIEGYEQEADIKFKALWKSPSEIAAKNAHLVPEGLEKFL